MKKTTVKPIFFILVILVLGFVLPLSGCALARISQFPALPGPAGRLVASKSDESQNSGTETSLSRPTDPIPSNAGDMTVTLRIAGPWSSNQLKLIGRYFELLQNQVTTLEGEALRGDQVSLDWLSAYPGDLNLIAMPLSLEQGVSPQQAKAWTATDSWPDVIVTNGLLDPQTAPTLMDLQPVVSASTHFRADRLIPRLFHLVQPTGTLNYLPWRFTRPVLYEDQAALLAMDLPDLPEPADWTQLSNHLQAVAAVGTGSEKRPVLANASQILQFWPASSNPGAGWSTWREGTFHFTDPELVQAVDALQLLERQGISTRLQDASAPAEGLQTNRDNPAAIYWFGNSSDLAAVRQSTDQPVHFHTLPLPGRSRLSAQPVSLFSLAVPASGSHTALAAQFAAFLAADPDAVKLQLRLDETFGYFPVVTDPTVWQQVSDLYPEGQNLADWPYQLTAAYIPGTYERADWTALHEARFIASWNQLLDSSQPQRVLNQLQTTFEVQDG